MAVKCDGTFLTFETPSAAVTFALRLQQIHHEQPELPKVRVGVHLGEVSERPAPAGSSKPIFIEGLAVDLAARIQSLARPGQVLMSQPVFAGAHQRLRGQEIEGEIRWRSYGLYRLKGIEEPVEIREAGFEGISPLEAPPDSEKATRVRNGGFPRHTLLAVGLVLIAAVATWMLWPAPSLAPIRSIAVLPFENLSGDPDQEYFADGMTEALIGHLAKISSLRVISRTSVMQYMDGRKPLPEIATELGVEAILEGTVMRAGDRVRITTQLIDARSDTHLWSESYDRELTEVLVLQSEVARAVSRQLEIRLSAAEATALAVQRTVDPRAYDLYLRGYEGFMQGNFTGQTLEQFERSAEVDPRFAEAFAHVAFLRAFRGDLSGAREPAQTALELDESSGKAHAALGWVRLLIDWDFGGAGRAFERALQLTPDDPLVLGSYQNYLFWIGRFDEALAVSKRVLLAHPISRGFRRDRVRLLVGSRQYERALEQIERLRELHPGRANYQVGRAYWIMGRHEEAHHEFIASWKQYPGFDWAWEAHERGWTEREVGGSPARPSCRTHPQGGAPL